MTTMNIKVVDVTEIGDPQVLAMLQAFYSRSPMSIDKRIESLTKDGDGETAADKIRNAIKRYYVDYGHASIGECGGATVFVEGISMLAAKAIQDHPLYVGQECSTRYIDFKDQPFISTSQQSYAIGEELRDIYLKALPLAYDYALKHYPASVVVSSKIPRDQVVAAHERTCKAIAFDYCRGILPAGATTSVAWTASFRTFNDHLRHLAKHPLAEVRHLAAAIYAELSTRYQSSFKQQALYSGASPVEFYYNMNPEQIEASVQSYWCPDVETFIRSLFNGLPTPSTRKHPSDNTMYFHIRGALDFGSYRDLQRHRNGENKMPLLTTLLGPHKFYAEALRSMDESLSVRLARVMTMVNTLDEPLVDRQYVIPMGMRVPTHLTWSLGQLKYVLGLRTKTTVHPTLREYMWSVFDSLDFDPNNAQLKIVRDILRGVIDRSPHYATSDRGEQTIKERPSGTTNS